MFLFFQTMAVPKPTTAKPGEVPPTEQPKPASKAKASPQAAAPAEKKRKSSAVVATPTKVKTPEQEKPIKSDKKRKISATVTPPKTSPAVAKRQTRATAAKLDTTPAKRVKK